VQEDSYVYFVDSTLIRIWLFDHALENTIHDYISSTVPGKFLTWEERRKYGVDTQIAGDLLFVCEEGVAPLPSFAGGARAKALHGYLPENMNQHGIMLTNSPLVQQEISTLQAYQFMLNYFKIE